MKREDFYTRLLEYYRKELEMIDVLHCNSDVARDVYANYGLKADMQLVPIVHAQITDNRKIKLFDDKKLRILFIGSENEYKGLPSLIEILKTLPKEKWQLSVWGSSKKKIDSSLPIRYYGKFVQKQMAEIFDNADLLVVPSRWNETFGFTILEAISYAIPVVVASNVGAKYVVNRYAPDFVYSTKKELRDLLELLMNDRSRLIEFNRAIVDDQWSYSVENHVEEILNIYK